MKDLNEKYPALNLVKQLFNQSPDKENVMVFVAEPYLEFFFLDKSSRDFLEVYYKDGLVHYRKKCVVCTHEYTSAKIDKTYCSPNCKKRAQRIRKRYERDLVQSNWLFGLVFFFIFYFSIENFYTKKIGDKSVTPYH